MSRKMNSGVTTPATVVLDRLGMGYSTHAYEHDPNERHYGDEAAIALGLDPIAVFKTLVVVTDAGRHVMAVVPVAGTAQLKAVAAVVGDKKAQLAPEDDVRRLTGYVLGGVSPIGTRTRLPVVVDDSAERLETMYVSGGRRGLDIGLSPSDLVRVCDARVAAVAAP